MWAALAKVSLLHSCRQRGVQAQRTARGRVL